MKLLKTAFYLMLFVLSVSFIENSPHKQFPPKDGCVPNSETAVKIAEAVLVGIHGKRILKSERPFIAELKDSIWVVHGTLGRGKMGGVTYVEIQKLDGKILNVYGTK